MASLNHLFDKLKIGKSGDDGIFSDELKETELTIFQPMSDFGYFRWDPKDHPYKPLSSIKASNEVTCYID
jgi:hypothetical protein